MESSVHNLAIVVEKERRLSILEEHFFVTGDIWGELWKSNGVCFWWQILLQGVLADGAPICFALIWQTTLVYGSYLAVKWGWKVCWIEWSTRTYILLVAWCTPTSFCPVGSIQFACSSTVSKYSFLKEEFVWMWSEHSFPAFEKKSWILQLTSFRNFGFDEKLVAGRIECKGALCTWMTSFMGLSQKALKKTAPRPGNNISKGHFWKGFFRTGCTENVQSAKTFGCFLWGCFAAENGLQSLQQLLWRWGLDHEIKSKLSTYEDSGFSHFHRFSIIEAHINYINTKCLPLPQDTKTFVPLLQWKELFSVLQLQVSYLATLSMTIKDEVSAEAGKFREDGWFLCGCIDVCMSQRGASNFLKLWAKCASFSDWNSLIQTSTRIKLRLVLTTVLGDLISSFLTEPFR